MSTRYALNKHKYLLDEEAVELERTLNLFHVEHLRDTTMFFTLLYTGARASELLGRRSRKTGKFESGLRVMDISRRTAFIRGLKGSDDREVPIPDWLFARLIKLAGTKGPEELLFPIGYRQLLRIWETYKTCDKNPHCLRHTFAIRQIRKHGRLNVLKKLLGHREISNTMIYADYAYDEDEFRRFVV